MVNLCVGLFIILALQQLCTLLAIKRSARFLQFGKAPHPTADPPTVAVVIPVLREQRSIRAALEYWSACDYPKLLVVVVSTEREGAIETPGSTMETLARLGHQYGFKWLHYSGCTGTKADQINHVVDHFGEISPDTDPDRTFIAIYDADSRPHPETLAAFSAAHQAHPSVRAFQQSSIFDIDPKEAKQLGMIHRAFLKASAIRASRFVLGYEVPRLLNRFAAYTSHGLRSAAGRVSYAHCVGHGLFLRLDLVRSIPFPQGSILEDMFYGFVLNCAREPVVPLTVLDRAEVPSRVRAIFFQMSRWFLGPSRTAIYSAYAMQYGLVKARAEAASLVAAGWFYSTKWLLTAPLICASLAGFVWGDAPVRLAAGAFILAYEATVVATAGIQNRALASRGPANTEARIRVSDLWPMIAVYPAMLIFHSFPAYHCILDLVTTGGRGNRGRKTERP